MRIQISPKLYQQLKSQRGPARQGGQLFDGGDEGGEGGGEGRGGEMGGKRVLEAVKVVVEDGHFAVEVIVEGLGGGGVGVHGGRDGGGNVFHRKLVNRSIGDWKGPMGLEME